MLEAHGLDKVACGILKSPPKMAREWQWQKPLKSDKTDEEIGRQPIERGFLAMQAHVDNFEQEGSVRTMSKRGEHLSKPCEGGV